MSSDGTPTAGAGEAEIVERRGPSIVWLIPAIVIALFIVGFMTGNTEQLADAAIAWVLANGVLSALGALIALGHPLTILAAFIAAPITSLNPTIGAGFVTGLVQAFIAPPQVKDMENVAEDISVISGWWKNRLTRVLLVFLFSSLGSAIGTMVAFSWLKDPKAGPTCKERHVYGLYTINKTGKAAEKLQKANELKPSMKKLEDAAAKGEKLTDLKQKPWSFMRKFAKPI